MFNRHPSQFLAKTDPKDYQQVEAATDLLKKWVRGKLKKSSVKEIAGKGGKLEELEIEFAHRGYQDIFYLTRCHLQLPPSRLNLPRPTTPVGRLLADANFTLRLPNQSSSNVNNGRYGADPNAEKRNTRPSEESQSRPSISSREDKGKRVTMKEITWGKEEAAKAKQKQPATPSDPTARGKGPSSPPSPILYVPPRPQPPNDHVSSPIAGPSGSVPKESDRAPRSKGSEAFGPGIASTAPRAIMMASPPATGLGIASTAPREHIQDNNPRASTALIHTQPSNSALRTPTKLPSPGAPTPSTINEPLPITPTSARTSSLGWPHGTANFRISQFGPSLGIQPVSPTPGPRRGSEGEPHVPHQQKIQQPQYRRPSAPFLTVPTDPAGYQSEIEETLDDEPPQLPPLTSPSFSPKTSGTAESSDAKKTSDPFVVAGRENGANAKGADVSNDKEVETRRALEEKIKALQSALQNLDSPKSISSTNGRVVNEAQVASSASSATLTKRKEQPHTAQQQPSSHTVVSQPIAETATASGVGVGQAQAPKIPLPPLPLSSGSSENRRPKPPPLNLKHSNLSETPSSSSLTPDGTTTSVKIPSPLRSSTVAEPVKTPVQVSGPPSRPQRPPSNMIPTSVKVQSQQQPKSSGHKRGHSRGTSISHHRTTSSASGVDYFNAKQTPSQSSSLAPSPTIVSTATKQPFSLAQAQQLPGTGSNPASASSSSGMRQAQISPLTQSSNALAVPTSVEKKEGKNGAPRLSIGPSSPIFLSDNWMTGFESELEAGGTSPMSTSSLTDMPSFPPPPSRIEPTAAPKSAPATQTRMRIPEPLDLDMDPRLVGKKKPSQSKSVNSTPMVDHYPTGSSPEPNSYSVGHGMSKSLGSFPPRVAAEEAKSPKSRSNSLPLNDDPNDQPRPYGRPSPAPSHTSKPPVMAKSSHRAHQSSRTPTTVPLNIRPQIPKATVGADSLDLPTPSRRAPVPPKTLDRATPKITSPINEVQEVRKGQGYRQSISARYAHKLQPQPQHHKPNPIIVQPDFGSMGEETMNDPNENQGEWVGFAV